LVRATRRRGRGSVVRPNIPAKETSSSAPTADKAKETSSP
jgi:hypothetical protein